MNELKFKWTMWNMLVKSLPPYRFMKSLDEKRWWYKTQRALLMIGWQLCREQDAAEAASAQSPASE